jgi:hypothetical protein
MQISNIKKAKMNRQGAVFEDGQNNRSIVMTNGIKVVSFISFRLLFFGPNVLAQIPFQRLRILNRDVVKN